MTGTVVETKVEANVGRRPLVLAAGAAFLVGLDTTAVNVALSDIGSDLDAGLDALQGVVTAFALLSAALLVAAGAVADRYGRRRVFIAGTLAFVVTSALCAAAPTDVALVVARGLQGAAGAAVVASGLAVLAASYPGEVRGRALGTFGAIASLSFVVGPLAGGALTDLAGWRLVFLVNVPIGIAVALLARRWLSVTALQERPVDVPGAVVFTIGLGAVTYALIDSWLPGLAVAAAALVALVLIERRSTHPMFDPQLFGSAAFAGAASAYAISGAGFFGLLTFLSLFLQDVLGYGATVAGLAFLPLVLPFMMASQISGRLIGLVGPRLLAVIGLLVFAGGMLLMLPVSDDSGLVDFLPGLAVAGAGGGLFVPPLNTAALNAIPPERIGVGSGILSTFRPVGVLLGTVLLGLAVRSTGPVNPIDADGYHAAAIAAASLGALAAVITAVTVRGR